MSGKEEKTIAKNRRARFEYEVLETFEAGIELTGCEVRSLRENNCQLTDCFALIRDGQVWLHNMHIPPFSQGTVFNGDPDRKRRLLMHKKEIRALERAVQQKGMALVPLRVYFNEKSLVKVEIALGRGKKLYDKRATVAARDSAREVARELKERSR